MTSSATAPTIEIALTWCEALSPLAAEIPSSTIRKLASSNSVALSFGRRARKRITPSALWWQPAMITRPSTSSALAKIEPMIDVRATTISPAESANTTTKNSGRFPSVDCRTPVTAGPKRSPTCSVANDTIQASPASASVEIPKVRRGVASA